MPSIVASSPATIKGLLVRSASARLHTPPAINTPRQHRRSMCGLPPRGSRREGDRDRDAGDRPTRPPGGGAGSEHCDEDDQHKQCPGQAERVDAVVEPGLERREDSEPERETEDRPDHRADGADDGAVRQQHESGRCFGVAPVAASMPSWRSRRCAMTVKPAAATSEARSRKTVATENIASAPVRWPFLPRARRPRPSGQAGLLDWCGSASIDSGVRVRPAA